MVKYYPIEGNAVIGQSGGPTAVINQSLAGCVEGLLECGFKGKILGAHNAVRGIVANDFIELQNIPQDRLNRIAATPSAALGSTRDKPNEEYCERILKSFKKNNVRYFFYIGGNDSSDTCRIVNKMAKETNYELRAFHISKTIDNDLMCNDHTPGFGSAAKYVACAFMGDNLDNRALAGIKINITMGRNAGFLTAASVLARQSPTDGPHLIYVPEVEFNIDKFIEDVNRVYSERGRCLIAVSEGIRDASGKAIAIQLAEKVEKDEHGNEQYSGSGALGDYLAKTIKERLGTEERLGTDLRVRADTLGYLQRGFAGCVSKIDQTEAREIGRIAAQMSMSGNIDGSIAIVRISDVPYRVEYKRIELSDVAAKTKKMPQEYIIDGCNISDAYKKYVSPIVGPLPVIELLRTHRV